MSSHYHQDALAIQDWIVQLRRQLHRFPEVMYEEVKTSQLVRQTLDQLGIAYQHPLAETGVLATLGNGNGPCVALRADMDALPIHEEADVSFRSEIAGKMHACGHDCHTAMLLGAARLLKEREADIQGTVKLIFQPAEEGGAGAVSGCETKVPLRIQASSESSVFMYGRNFPVGSFGSRAGVFLGGCRECRRNHHPRSWWARGNAPFDGRSCGGRGQDRNRITDNRLAGNSTH